ncbi:MULTISPECIES: hypothetical protein [Moorena]|uniref:Uncharacterized protein n=2 Tax=Moorena TaxID=1155738 RepID=F4XSK0_9CYAN|nr:MULTISPECIES: hypothetical protein [Moorena]EGJ32413.1 hypothetical protein LYNGBM3L_18460 [Moorena producens 3L]NEP69850.1 hypothetical protein [Moorena sp. SIO3A5]NEQ07679.1 hypothetical protein [Moorena sp. SIO4E2]NER85826.1 hypothetical protein [Moorena sp. SIO3A2]NES41599.1 hypothetical protein [Moorena sp. SIO2C4]
MEQINSEIDAIRQSIAALRAERDTLTRQEIILEDQSPEAIAQAYRRQASENAQRSVEILGIDNAIAALEAQLEQKQQQLQPALTISQPLTLEDQIEQATQQAYDHAERINELAAELAEELKALKAIAHDLSPIYWKLYHRPFVTGFRSTSVPYLRSDHDVLRITKLVI